MKLICHFWSNGHLLWHFESYFQSHCLNPHGDYIEQQARQESLLPFLTDGKSETQRGDTICPGSHRASRRARVTKAMGGAPFHFVTLRWGYTPASQPASLGGHNPKLPAPLGGSCPNLRLAVWSLSLTAPPGFGKVPFLSLAIVVLGLNQ